MSVKRRKLNVIVDLQIWEWEKLVPLAWALAANVTLTQSTTRYIDLTLSFRMQAAHQI